MAGLCKGSCVIHEWRETDHKVQIYGGGKSVVITSYLFSIMVAMGTGKQTMQGRDMVGLVKEGRKWLVAADQFSPEPVHALPEDPKQIQPILPV